jgi:hypothetical protein
MLNGLEYHKIDDEGLHISTDDMPSVLEVDTTINQASYLAAVI